MKKIKIDKDYLNIVKKDFQNYVETKYPLLRKNLPKFIKKFYNIYFIFPFYIIDRTFDNISFRRDFLPKNIKKVKMPPELTIDLLETNEIHNKYEETLQIEVDTFLDILEKNFKREDLTIFFRNIQTLDFKEVKELNDDTIGYYTPNNNKITLIEGADSNTIIHELFHMASSYVDKEHKITYTGFRQRGKELDLGKGLNEGYTELLANRYSNTIDSSGYIYETKYAKILEDIIGKELMQSLYLQANLKGLINELTNYQTEEKIMQFIQNMDILVKYKKDKLKENQINNCLKNIEIFLIETYLVKTKVQLKETYFQNKDSFEKCLQDIHTKAYGIPRSFFHFPTDEIDSIIENYLGNIINEKRQQIEKAEYEEMESRRKQEMLEWEKEFKKLQEFSEKIQGHAKKLPPIVDYNFVTGESDSLNNESLPKR